MLELKGVAGGYGSMRVLNGVDLLARAGQITCIMGRTGAGKTTLLRAIMGALRPVAGSILLGGEEISQLPAHHIPAKGLAWVPQGRRLFSGLTVAENLSVGGLIHGNDAETRMGVLAMFPRLAERLEQRAETLSGGEQQMLAIARALCLKPKVILLDEPTEGLQPSMIQAIREVLLQLRAAGVAVVLVEQRVEAVLSMADRVGFMSDGRIAAERAVVDLEPGAAEFATYVGV